MDYIAVAPEEMEGIADRLPTTKAEFLEWSPDDDTLYEWHEGVLIPQSGMKKKGTLPSAQHSKSVSIYYIF